MGTSGSYGGSGGRDWSALRHDLEHWLDTLPGGTDESGEGGSDDENPRGEPPRDPRAPDAEVLRILRPLARALLTGSTGTGSSGGGAAGGSRALGKGRSPSGTGRTSTRVGRVGGRLAAGVTGFRSGDTLGLLAIGLDLAELQALDPYRQAQRLLRAATEQSVATTLEEEEIQAATSRTAIWALTETQGPDIEEVIRRFIVEYVYEVFLTEGGAVLRGGERDGVAATAAEDRVRDTIVALVRGTPIDQSRLDPNDLANATERVLNDALVIHGNEQ